jgi:hypothetical protein
MKKILFYVASAIALLVFAPSCEDGRDHPEVIEPQVPENAIGFSGSKWGDVPSSRSAGELTSAADITKMTVYAHAAGTDHLATSQPDVMLNQLVERSNGNALWTYSPIKYWPANNGMLSFFAITPALTEAGMGHVSLVTNNGTSYTGYPAFVVTPPTSPSQHTDIGVASAPDHTQSDGPVPLTFHHAMAKVKFSAKYTTTTNTDLCHVSIRKIELMDVYGSNILRFVDPNNNPPGFLWDVLDGSSQKAGYTLTQADNTLADITLNRATSTTVSTDAGTLMLIPQTAPTDANMKVTFCMDGREMEREAKPSFTFAVGQSYNYGLTLDLGALQVWDYSYTGTAQEFVAPKAGTYRLEVWGGGTILYDLSVLGGYSSGEIDLSSGQILYVYVGQSGTRTVVGGFNGGGRGDNNNGAYGGGASDFRLVNGLWNNATSLNSRIIVAGGACFVADPGGGLVAYGKTPGTQTSATHSGAGFGYGAGSNIKYGRGGGGGYYGGGHTTYTGPGGGGGSSFISGMKGCVAIDPTDLSGNPRKQDGGANPTALNYNSSIFSANSSPTWENGEEIIFLNPSMIDGQGHEWNTGSQAATPVGMPGNKSCECFTMLGNKEHGYARVTLIN